MQTNPAHATVENREGLIRLADASGREHIFAPYRLDTALPKAPGLIAFVRPARGGLSKMRGIISPPCWEVLYIEQSSDVSSRAGGYLRRTEARNLGATLVMVRWMPGSEDEEREGIERMLIQAHDPELNRRPEKDPMSAVLALPW